MPVAARMTADEYLALPERTDHRRKQLIDGVIVVDEPLPLHQWVLQELFLAVSDWTRARSGRGRAWLPLDVRIDDHSVYGPDILWYAEGQGPAVHGGRPSPTPDLAVEVRSPSTWRYDTGAKKRGYERRGLPELWLADTSANEVLVYRRSEPRLADFDVTRRLGRTDTLTSPAMPGFALALDALFPPAAQ